MRDGDPLVLPAQRPASPEIAESPSVTTVGVPTPGPSARAGAASTRAAPHATSDIRKHERIRSPSEVAGDRLARERRLSTAAAGHGWKTTLKAPSSFFWNIS